MFLFKKERTVIFTIAFLFVLLPVATQAATIYFEPQEDVLGTEGSFFVGVLLDVSEKTNAISVTIDVPPQLTPVDTRDSNSIISLWVQKPNWDELTRKLTFSGLIPGGFSGQEAWLIAIEFIPTGILGKAELSFDSTGTSLLESSPSAERIPLDFRNLTLRTQDGKRNIPVEIIDSDPPEAFVPLIVQHKDAFDGKYAVVFFTQDKGSGMCCYEVVEKRGVVKNNYKKLNWRDAESPYILRDQSLESFIYIKALDKEGNERIAVIAPQSTPAGYLSSSIIGILTIMGVVALAFLVHRRRKQKDVSTIA